MNEPLRKRDVEAVGDELADKLDGMRDELVTVIREWRADVHRLFRRTLIELIVSMTVLNGITFTAYAAVLRG